jgi:hypothetical protein
MRASGANSTALKEGPGAEHDAASGSCFNYEDPMNKFVLFALAAVALINATGLASAQQIYLDFGPNRGYGPPPGYG